ncbi:hypothetical protein [Caenimonas koreensis]|uniref:Uncharacterized protein n=1 Tax=Caenimonas koreensis DSM 17982 TaxID=1121255 RepID=A0A844B1X9_9BURK|nr:hypothetical protein [Caenimonas koreensis]MRD47193.1 hypothetical protein [Caenimonas koreensis DSM 17982]
MQAIPSSEALRQAALQASWARDTAVRRRRLTWRWAKWLGTRWIFPVVAAAALGWVPASWRVSLPLTRSELSQPAGLQLSPGISAAAPPIAAPPAGVEPQPGISLRPEQKLKTKEKQ